MSGEGIDDVFEGLLRQGLTAATQLAEQLARARPQYLKKAEHEGERAAMEAQRNIAAERATMRAVVVPTTQDEWWSSAKPDQVAQAHLMATAWKDHGPDALAASERIAQEVKNRYGMDTADAGGDGAYLQDRIAVVRFAEQQQRMAKEHAEAMALVAAAQAEELNRLAGELQGQLERHQVPREDLANPELVAALQASREAEGTDAATEADRAMAERMHLIKKDGIAGPSIEQLHAEIGQNYSGTRDSHFADAEFVAAARDWHESRALAEGGFADRGNTGIEARYTNAEKELFARLAPMGRDIEDKVLKDPSTVTAATSEQSTGPDYGSREHYESFATSLKGTASEQDIKGRVAAARGQAKYPSEAVQVPKNAPKACKPTAGAGAGRDKAQDGPAR
ncbi:hypothetical protein [Arthrobacter sp. ZGTC131]|uniref:hypothetical protein n=1 Tax=Arthrobacter sp. ZGTC131 TaxID=2058898 RepID=UPI000CE38EE8|nr:hypothetical protein [Arthrobacter sp. ZGTC131]